MQSFSHGSTTLRISAAADSLLAGIALELIGVKLRVKETSAVNLAESVQAGRIWPAAKVLWRWWRRESMAGCLIVPLHAQASIRSPVPGTRPV